jgi:hypothetical protein
VRAVLQGLRDGSRLRSPVMDTALCKGDTKSFCVGSEDLSKFRLTSSMRRCWGSRTRASAGEMPNTEASKSSTPSRYLTNTPGAEIDDYYYCLLRARVESHH